jgi:hypothetical protein
MSARNMVRSLRDSGALDGPAAAPSWQSNLLFFATALLCGAVFYFAVIHGLPALIHAMEKPPAPVSYAKPGG